MLASLDEQPFDGSPKIVPLAWHVDYWNDLGWKDRFSSPRYSERQRQYADWLSTSVYTPQMVMNGRADFVGSDESRAHSLIRSQKRHPFELEVAITSGGAGAVDVNVRVNERRGHGEPLDRRLDVILVMTEDHLKTEVKRGENTGKTLRHIGVVRTVRRLETPETGKPIEPIETVVNLPPEWDREHVNLVVFLQSPRNGHVLGVAERKLL